VYDRDESQHYHIADEAATFNFNGVNGRICPALDGCGRVAGSGFFVRCSCASSETNATRTPTGPP
jgi:hypothetical protein